tara:strand:+ start:3857 stop:4075 length:219 start_codon:yes stop_codon:yes gene_type:complete
MGSSIVKPVQGVTIEQWQQKRWTEMSLNQIPNGGGLIQVDYSNNNICEGNPLYEVIGIPLHLQNLYNMGMFE